MALLFGSDGPMLAPFYDIASTEVYGEIRPRPLVTGEEIPPAPLLIDIRHTIELCGLEFQPGLMEAIKLMGLVCAALNAVAEDAWEEGWTKPAVEEAIQIAMSRAMGFRHESVYLRPATGVDRCSGGDDDHDDEGGVEGEPAEHRGQLEAAAAVQRLVSEEAAGEAQRDREGGVGAQRPVGEQQPDPEGDGRLEDHRAGDVAERQRVLAVAHPEEAVDLLRQLGGERGEDQGEDDRLDAEVGRRS